MEDNAEITSEHSFFNGRKLQIVEISAADVLVNAKEELANPPQVNAVHSTFEEDTSIEELKNIRFNASTLLIDINKWANERNFHLSKTEGVKANKEGVFRSFKCNEKKCRFRLTFQSNSKGEIFELNQRLALKNNKHSNKFEDLFLKNRPLTCL